MDQFFESLLEGFFESFLDKIKDYISDIENKVTGFGTAIGKSIAAAIIAGMWGNLQGRFILLVFGLWAVYIVRVFVHDMIALYGLATDYWRVTMFVIVTTAVLYMVTLKGEGVEIYEDVEVDESAGEVVSRGPEKVGERPRATSYSYWWTRSVRRSNGKVQTTTEETTTLKVSADGKRTRLDVHKASKRTHVQKLLKEKMPQEDELLKLAAPIKPSKLVAADQMSTVQLSPDGRSIFAAGIDPTELDIGLQLRSEVSYTTGKPVYFEVRVGIKDPKGWIGIGLCTRDSPTTGMPGWFEGSFAYHGDDGTFFEANQEGKPYGPTYGMFDVIGCGVNYEKDELFFTKNGDYIGKASAAPSGELFAVVGLGYKGARFSINFGQAHFHYNS